MKEKEKKYGLLKGILIFLAVAAVLTWLIPNGEFQTTAYISDGALTRVGLNDIAWLIFYGIYFSIDQMILLLAISGMYGILVKTKAYDKLVTGIAKKFKNKKLTVVLFSVIIALLTSLLTQTWVVLIFVPFIISILNRMKLDKMTILATTFGSMLVGILGATYGTQGLVTLIGYMVAVDGTAHDTMVATILVRAGILLIGLVLFNFFTLTHMKKAKENSESIEIFKVEEDNKDNKKQNVIPIIVIGILLLVLSILAFVDWETNFNITFFKELHDTIINIKIGNDFFIFNALLGSNMGALGSWDLFGITAVVLLFTIILALCYRFSFNDFIDGFVSGMKKMVKPCLCIVGATTLMVIVYMSLYVSTIMNKLLTLTDGFNLFTMMISSLIANIFHTDLGYTGMVAGSYLITEYADYINPIQVIYISLYGFVQFFIPTSVVLGVGLTTLKVKYGDWLKYIWRFLLGMFVCLLLIFILMAVL